jgi:hypothetical protein
MFLARAGLKVHPELTVGVEGTAAPTSYDQPVLNNGVNYSAGVYGDWHPGHNFSLRPSFGYSVYDFQQTSLFVLAQNVNNWYADVNLQHQPTKAISYGIDFGHGSRLGFQSDVIVATYARPAVTWNLLKNISLQAGAFYEHGTQSGGSFTLGSFTLEENYDWYGGNIGAVFSVMKNLQASLSYRLTFRSSNLPSDEYTQNLVTLVVTYTPR